MRGISRFLGIMLLLVNLVFAGFLVLSGYSSYIHPVSHPYLAATGLAFPFFLIVNVAFLLFWIMVYRKYALLSLMVLLICYKPIHIYFPLNQLKTSEKETLKVLSYNTLSLAGHAPHTGEKKNPVLEYILGCKADIVCLQEVQGGGELSLNRIKKVLKYPYSHFQQLDGGNGLACYSRFPIITAKRIDYESDNNGSVLYLIKIENDTVAVINNHLESNKLTMDDRELYSAMLRSPKKSDLKGNSKMLGGKIAEAGAIRARQADVIAEVVKEQLQKGRSLVVCGDFNDSPLAYPHRVIGDGLNDAFVEAGSGIGVSYNRNYFYFRIDHILVSKDWTVTECVVDRSTKASDHYPVWGCMYKK